jgi:hypothetical protein
MGSAMRLVIRGSDAGAQRLPELQEAMSAMLLQADEGLVKPIEIASL